MTNAVTAPTNKIAFPGIASILPRLQIDCDATDYSCISTRNGSFAPIIGNASSVRAERGVMLDIVSGTRTLISQGWLSGMPAEFRQQLMSMLVWRKFAAGTPIFWGGDESGGIYGVASGQLDLVLAARVDAPIGHVGLPGSWHGLGPMFGSPRTTNVTARTDSLLALAPISALNSYLSQHPVAWRYFGRLAFDYALQFGFGMVDLTNVDSRQRSIAVLLRFANCRQTGDTPVTIQLTQAQLAESASLSRHPTGVILRELADMGLISLAYGSITLIDPAALRALVE